jgi:hypothetical protein
MGKRGATGDDARMNTTTAASIDSLAAQREQDVQRAMFMRQRGASIYEIALTLGRSKEWLRTYAGIR